MAPTDENVADLHNAGTTLERWSRATPPVRPFSTPFVHLILKSAAVDERIFAASRSADDDTKFWRLNKSIEIQENMPMRNK